ncbi:FAD:protein FMN transferase [Solirubrobacter ginsenosidimutans]|uniref:FAD:protein FMN transferase n=1 Tax=Solirubrobacter ginsenosidimutans TaxID=490573 RepID=A0A9X3S200_9ACTN|nr:FAD:protein FMN transferase [Solirubrobacter ginsenosidimutans]MDA0161657.1 FAD:protein FMN transferase [Solirubrobacter ginsenosidimutans]
MPTVPLPRSVFVERVMGTVVSLDVRTTAPDPAVLRAAFASLQEADVRFSPFRADSELRRFERGEVAEISADLRWVLDRCAALRLQTGGFFDAYATGRLDPSALVKGWAAQRVAGILHDGGITDFCLNAGGDVITRGDALPERGWRVGIQHPLDPDAVAARVRARDLAIATSGTYERGEHIIDPWTAAAPGGVLSVTVAGADLGAADAYSTAAFAMGADGPAWTLGLDGYEAMTILADGTVLSTPGFPLLEEDE